ncbi:hypothetical protein HDU87_003468 [Geranomyces variabilis]|uniref:Uncharacterized protein n=1 Tax=Geranomyces variabilis TaxID=109894 RepID=A0AAD5TK23_9FUNG|nr:hypothetical protein HDU87_003468 [Geranomyces variabilis]
MAQRDLTAGEECQLAAKTFSTFVDKNQGAIPPVYITSAMGCAICRGNKGVAVVRLKSGEWSAPCAIELESQSSTIQPAQETVLVFMTENVIHKLVSRALLRLGVTDQFKPGPIHGNEPINPAVDVYGWVRFNGGFTPPELIASNMVAWFVREDPQRHGRWHGESVTWFDVLTNKITVDRSSVGNALYIVMNLAAGGSASGVDAKRKNFANLDAISNIAPSITKSRPAQQPQQNASSYPQQQVQQPQQQQQQPQMNAYGSPHQDQYGLQQQQQQPLANAYGSSQQNQYGGYDQAALLQQQQQQHLAQLQYQQQQLQMKFHQQAAALAQVPSFQGAGVQTLGYPSPALPAGSGGNMFGYSQSMSPGLSQQSPQLSQQSQPQPQQAGFDYQAALSQQLLANQQWQQQQQSGSGYQHSGQQQYGGMNTGQWNQQ